MGGFSLRKPEEKWFIYKSAFWVKLIFITGKGLSMSDEIIEFCKKKWEAEEDDPRVKYFIDNKADFYKDLTGKMKDLIDSFLKDFDYYSHKSVNIEYKQLHYHLLKAYGIDICNSIITVLKSQDNTYNSSYYTVGEYMIINNISEDLVYPDIRDCFDILLWEVAENVIFIDDFCGTGDTFCDYVNIIKSDLGNKKVFYIVVHAMQQGIDRIKEFCDINSINIQVICNHISEPVFCNNDYKSYKAEFERMSKERNIYKKYIFGYKHSEALVAFYRNTPNNTLGIFWYDSDKNKSIFPRKNNKSVPRLMKEKRKQKEASNYVCSQKSR